MPKRGRRARAEIKDRMSEIELRDAGVMIDLPTEAASANPQPLRYADGSTSNDPDRPWNKPRPRKSEDVGPETG